MPIAGEPFTAANILPRGFCKSAGGSPVSCLLAPGGGVGMLSDLFYCLKVMSLLKNAGAALGRITRPPTLRRYKRLALVFFSDSRGQPLNRIRDNGGFPRGLDERREKGREREREMAESCAVPRGDAR